MYEIKKGYLTNSNFKLVIHNLDDYVDISWYESIHQFDKTNLEKSYWSSIHNLLKSNYVLIDLNYIDEIVAFETGVAWTVNYIRKLLTRSGHKNAVAQLNKFGLCDKNILACESKTTNLLNIPIKDQGKIFKKSTDITKWIKTKES